MAAGTELPSSVVISCKKHRPVRENGETDDAEHKESEL